jgi:hypothetical protein
MSRPAHLWDVFISHASEDTHDVVAPLARILEGRGLSVWFDKAVLTLGDSLREKIDEGLAGSRFGVVVLSGYFFAKNWPRKELDGLFAKEAGGAKVILPVWHELGHAEIRRYSPLLADRLAVSTKDGLDSVAEEILRAVRRRPKRAGKASADSLIEDDVARLRELAIGVRDPSASRRHLRVFTQEALKHNSPELRRQAIDILKDRLGFVASEEGAPAAVRRLRQDILRSLKALAPAAFGSFFADGEFEGMDLYGVDFSGGDMQRVSFRDAFLVEADFTGACLDRADFTGSYLRNANFAGASLIDANLTDADWFNAVGLTSSQLFAARSETIAACPAGVAAMEAFLRNKYGFPLETWDPRIQAQLRDTWQHYLAKEWRS